MGIPREPKPVKLFVALLCGDESLASTVERGLRVPFGPIDLASPLLPWSVTSYYERELGRGLLRRFVSFAPLISPDQLPELKLATQSVEASHRWSDGQRSGRKINIDPGYLEATKIVLASTKHAAHRLYLREGIYGEVSLVFANGAFQSCPTTYPDYRWPETLSYFSALRSLYLGQLKKGD